MRYYTIMLYYYSTTSTSTLETYPGRGARTEERKNSCLLSVGHEMPVMAAPSTMSSDDTERTKSKFRAQHSTARHGTARHGTARHTRQNGQARGMARELPPTLCPLRCACCGSAGAIPYPPSPVPRPLPG